MKGKKERTSSPPPTGGKSKKTSVAKQGSLTDSKKALVEAKQQEVKKQEAEKEGKPDDAQSEINAADYVPVKKDVIIGKVYLSYL